MIIVIMIYNAVAARARVQQVNARAAGGVYWEFFFCSSLSLFLSLSIYIYMCRYISVKTPPSHTDSCNLVTTVEPRRIWEVHSARPSLRLRRRRRRNSNNNNNGSDNNVRIYKPVARPRRAREKRIPSVYRYDARASYVHTYTHTQDPTVSSGPPYVCCGGAYTRHRRGARRSDRSLK